MRPFYTSFGTEAQFYRISALSIKKKGKLRELDPHLQREKDQYGHALPSREFILQVLEEQGIPMREETLQSLLGIIEPENEMFARHLSSLLREGQTMRSPNCAKCGVE